jgi:sugar phosphate isomerase/epimerase
MEKRSPIGLRVNDLRTDVRSALAQTRRMAFSAVELAVDDAELTPRALSTSGRQHLARLIRGEGLDLVALASDAHGGGICDSSRVDDLVLRAAESIRLAADMRVAVLSHDVGDLLGMNDTQRATAVDALHALADQAERTGTIYAIRSRAGAPDEVRRLIEIVDCPLVRVAIDPATLIMSGLDPVQAIATFGEQTVLAYVRDATSGTAEHTGREIALGQGRLALDAYLAELAAAGCARTPVLRRAAAASPAADLAADKAVLLSHMGLSG